MFTENQLSQMGSTQMCNPITLGAADLTKSFIYDRKWGLFYVPFGYHTAAAGVLLAFHRNLENRFDLMGPFGAKLDSSRAAETYFETTPGTAYKSSVGSRQVRTWNPVSLSAFETRLLGPLEYLES